MHGDISNENRSMYQTTTVWKTIIFAFSRIGAFYQKLTHHLKAENRVTGH